MCSNTAMTSAHLTSADLRNYLRRSRVGHAAAIRDHLDQCARCWDDWNAYRWTAAGSHPLYAELARHLGVDFQPGRDSSRDLAAEWDHADPHSAERIAQFFRESVSYLYNLVIWEASGNRPNYLDAALPHLAEHTIRTVIDIGSGIGSDALALHEHGYQVTTCDYDSPSTRFARQRAGGRTLSRIEPGQLGADHAADALWIIDTLDHLPDIGFTLGAVLPHARLMITENLGDSRAHGRQRFHHRRTVAEIADIFSQHGLDHYSMDGAITVWTRTR